MHRFRFGERQRPGEYALTGSIHDAEVDLLIGQGSSLLTVEIKSAKTFSAHLLKGLARFGELAGDQAQDGVLVFNGKDRGTARGVRLLGFDEIGSLY